MACAIDHEFEPRRFLLFCLKSEPCGSMLATCSMKVVYGGSMLVSTMVGPCWDYGHMEWLPCRR